MSGLIGLRPKTATKSFHTRATFAPLKAQLVPIAVDALGSTAEPPPSGNRYFTTLILRLLIPNTLHFL